MADMRKCAECGVSVKVENLPAHYAKQHPRAEVPEALQREAVQVVRAAKAARAPAPVALTRNGKILIAAVAVVLAVVLIVIIVNPFRVGPNVGKVAPDFTLTSTTGSSVTLSALRGEPVLLEFMDVDCPHCQNEATNVLSSLYTAYNARVHFFSVDVNFVPPDDTDTRINAFKTTYNTPWTYALDSTRTVQTTYGITSTPTTYILDRNGVITDILIGEQSGGYATYSNALDAALRV